MISCTLIACGRSQSHLSQEIPSPQPSQMEQPESPANEVSETPARKNTPDITSQNLSEYLAGLSRDYECQVDDPSVQEDTATYPIHVSKHERFADMTGEYHLILRWNPQSNDWEYDSESSDWIETDFSLNLDEFYDKSYYWAAYPVDPTSSDPMYFLITDMTEESCTITWWSRDYDNTVINNEYEGTAQAELVMEYLDGKLQHPHWVLENIQLDTAMGTYAGGKNIVSYTIEITPSDFSIVPSEDTAKYIYHSSITLKRISNE